jgi:hypothetical protein
MDWEEMNDYWMRGLAKDLSVSDGIEITDQETDEDAQPTLRYPGSKAIDLGAWKPQSLSPTTTSPDTSAPKSSSQRTLNGYWSGYLTDDQSGIIDDMDFFYFTVTETSGQEDVTFAGSGRGAYGAFSIDGKMAQDGQRIVFTKSGTSEGSFNGEKWQYQYDGEMSKDFDEIRGTWGLPYTEAVADENALRISGEQSYVLSLW